MRRLSERRYALLLIALLGFVIGQWFAVIHATQHELSAGHTDSCQICAVAHAAGGTPAVSLVPAATARHSKELPAPVIERAALQPIARPRCRAPPFLFA